MAVIKKKKSAFEDAFDRVRGAASNLVSGAGRAVQNATKTAGNFYQDFSKGYNNFQQQQNVQGQQLRNNTVGLTNRVLQATPIKTASNYFNAQKDVNTKQPGLQNFWTSTPGQFVGSVQKGLRGLPVGLEKAKSGAQSGVALTLKNMNESTRNQTLFGFGNPLGEVPGMNISRKIPGFPSVQYKDIFPKTDVSFGLADKFTKLGKETGNKAEEMAKKLPTFKGGLAANWTNPEYVTQNLAMNVPSFLASLGIGGAVGLTTKNPVLAFTASAGSSYLQNGGETYAEAMRQGADEPTARQAANLTGTINGMLDAYGVGGILNRLSGPVRGLLVKQIVQNIASNAGRESATESMQQVVSNTSAKFYYDHQRDLFAGVPESAFFGALLGGGGSVAVDTAINTLQPKKTTTPLDELTTILEQGRTGQQTIGQLQQQTQSPDLTSYENALNRNDMVTVTSLAEKYPDDARYQVHKSLPQNQTQLPESQPFESKTESIVSNLEEELKKPEVAAIKADMDQLIDDTGQEIVPVEATQTGPTANTEGFNMNKDQAEAAIKSFVGDAELAYITGDQGIQTPEGNIAHGKYFDSIISVVEQNGKVQDKTVYHEAFHAYVDKFVDKSLYKTAIDDVVANNKVTDKQATEILAEDFADWRTGRDGGWTQNVVNFFTDLLASVRTLIGKESSANMIYRNMIEGKRAEGVGAPVEEQFREAGVEKSKPGKPNVSNPEDFPRRPGEINVNRLDLNKTQKKHIRKIVEKDSVESLTDAEVKAFAKIAGFDTKSYTPDQVKQIIAERLNTRRQVVELEKQADALKKAGAPIEEIVAAERAIAETTTIVESQARAEGQMLAARRILADEISTPRQRVFQLLNQKGINPEQYTELAASVDFNNADDVIKFWRTLVPASKGEWFDKLRYNAMLSSPNTHIVNMASNFQGTGFIIPADLIIQGTIDKAVSALTGAPRTRYAGEGVAYAQGFWSNQTTALKSAFNVLQKGVTVNGIENFDPYMAPLTKPGDKLRPVEAVLDVPSKLLAGEDAVSMTGAKQGFKASLAYRNKRLVEKQPSVKLKDVNKEAERRAKQSIFRGDLYNPGEGMILDALGFIAERGLKAATSPRAPGFVRWPAKMSIPFINIGTNLAKQGLESNPITGLINLSGNMDKTASVSKMIMGGAVTAIAASYALQGRLQAGEDEDKTKRDQARAAGILPWSIQVNTPFGEQYIQFNKMHPVLAFQLGAVASIAKALEDGKLNPDKGKVFSEVLGKTLQYFNDQTYWKNVGDFVNVLNGDAYEIGSLAYNYPAQAIPYRALGGWISRITDEYVRSPNPDQHLIPAVLDRIQAGVPGLSTNVPAKENPYGELIKHPNRMFNLVSPYKTSPLNEDQYGTYLKMKERTDINKLEEMQSKPAKEAEDALNQQTPEEKRAAKEAELDKEINRGKIKVSKGAAPGTTGGLNLLAQAQINKNEFQYFDEDSGDVKTIDLAGLSKSKTGIGKNKQDANRYSTARKIHEADLPQEDKDAAYKKLGVTKEEVRYDTLANFTEEVKTNYLIQKADEMDHEELLDRLVTGRDNALSGKMFATDAVLNNLVDEGILSEDEYKALKSIKYNKAGNLIASSGGGKGKKVDFSIDAKYNAPDVSNIKLSGPSARSKPSALYAPFKTKRANAKIKMPTSNVQKPTGVLGKRLSLNLRPMAKTLSGLGRIT